jgi:U6 snRNA-associated Sm-like protein LSm6
MWVSAFDANKRSLSPAPAEAARMSELAAAGGAGAKAGEAGKGTNPREFLQSVLGKPVQVILNSGVTYKGILACLDGFMNIAMEQSEEYVDGQLKARYGDCFIRGNNVLCIISLAK